MALDADIAEKLRAGESLTRRRSRTEGARGNVDVEEFDIVCAAGTQTGVLTVREAMDPSPPHFTQRSVSRTEI
jgi:hypothetical protein